MSYLSQISRNSTHFTKLNVKTSGLLIMHQTVLGLRKTQITPSKLFITSTSYSSFDSGELALSDTVIKKISKILTKINIIGWGGLKKYMLN